MIGIYAISGEVNIFTSFREAALMKTLELPEDLQGYYTTKALIMNWIFGELI